MKSLYFLTALCIISITSFSQSQEMYVSPRFSEIAKQHKIIAILPFKTIIGLRPNEMAKLSREEFFQLQKDEGLAVQSALHTYFLKRKEQKELLVEFQDLMTTNALLAKNNITQDNMNKLSPEELSAILGVDGVVSGTLLSNKPLSEAAAAAVRKLANAYTKTNTGKCTIIINDGATGEVLWKYDKTLSRGLGSDTYSIIETMMRKASRLLPYIHEL